MLSLVLVEHVGGDVKDDVQRMDVAGFALCSKAGTAGSEWIDREIRNSEGSNKAEGIVNLNGKVLPVNSCATSKARDLCTSVSALGD